MLPLLLFGFLFAAAPATAITVKAVAAENFYGDVIGQIGGDKVNVTSIMSDPNVDPHEYESNVADAKLVADASLVIESGGGYDDWMDKLVAASPDRGRMVLKGFDIATTKIPDNEHIWYDPDNMIAIARAAKDALAKIDPDDAAAFNGNFDDFKASIETFKSRQGRLRTKYANSPIALTETIYQYQARLLGLSVLTPEEFQKAVAEGNDPPADSIVLAEAQIVGKKVKALVYNEQTITDITTKLQNDAKAAGIPVVPVTETMPTGLHYQAWMSDELDALVAALGK